MKQWYLIKTKSRQENIAIKNLKNQNFNVYCPFTTISNKIVALFPGYVFIQLDKNTQNWAPIRSTKGVLNFVRFGLNFAKISNNIIDFIKANDYINISCNVTNGIVRIMALNGQVVKEIATSNLISGQRIDLDLDNGIYLIEVSSNGNRTMRKLVVSH